jgi:hypothetical protein
MVERTQEIAGDLVMALLVLRRFRRIHSKAVFEGCTRDE